ncbi:MAG: hypothetical protein PWQ41_633 [Bacillota bacterium]|nr:hypothetical protein [Bacillota bacterium]MDK2855019.1 hypothetical protein [Bacillota bacterium]MDK2924859.1 hypothetical protein [Bacillota bacterium]
MSSNLFCSIEALREELYRVAGTFGGNMARGRVLELSCELDKYLLLATRELSGLSS